MAPVTVLSVLALVAAATAQPAAAALHNTRSRHNSADLAARKIGAIAPREVALESSVHKKRTHKKKRCDNHSSGSSGSSSSSSGSSSSGSSSSSSGSSSSGGSSSSSGGDSGSGSQSSSSGGSSSNSGGGGGDESGLEWVGKPSSGFQGTQSGGIMSWFQADSGQDSTNGVSWCNIHYENWMPLFAPDILVMSPSGATWGSNPQQWMADASKWCGLEAVVTYNGKQTKMIIGDAFDHTWVKTPASIDVLYDTFKSAYGGDPGYNKNVVGMDVSWYLTGYRDPKYAFHN